MKFAALLFLSMLSLAYVANAQGSSAVISAGAIAISEGSKNEKVAESVAKAIVADTENPGQTYAATQSAVDAPATAAALTSTQILARTTGNGVANGAASAMSTATALSRVKAIASALGEVEDVVKAMGNAEAEQVSSQTVQAKSSSQAELSGDATAASQTLASALAAVQTQAQSLSQAIAVFDGKNGTAAVNVGAAAIKVNTTDAVVTTTDVVGDATAGTDSNSLVSNEAIANLVSETDDNAAANADSESLVSVDYDGQQNTGVQEPEARHFLAKWFVHN